LFGVLTDDSIGFVMMITSKRSWILLVAIICHVVTGLQDLNSFKQKFQYKHSFKGPNLVNDLGDIHFWEYGGS